MYDADDWAIDSCNYKGRNVLCMAAFEEKIDILKLLLNSNQAKQWIQVTMKGNNIKSLFFAIRKKLPIDIIQSFINAGVNINYSFRVCFRDYVGWYTPLYTAIATQNWELAKYLVCLPQIRLMDDTRHNGINAVAGLVVVNSKESKDFVKWFLQSRPVKEYIHRHNGNVEAVIVAVNTGASVNLVEQLIAGVNPYYVNDSGESALNVAIKRSSCKLVKLLIQIYQLRPEIILSYDLVSI